jgi:hypothetical protein
MNAVKDRLERLWRGCQYLVGYGAQRLQALLVRFGSPPVAALEARRVERDCRDTERSDCRALARAAQCRLAGLPGDCPDALLEEKLQKMGYYDRT